MPHLPHPITPLRLNLHKRSALKFCAGRPCCAMAALALAVLSMSLTAASRVIFPTDKPTPLFALAQAQLTLPPKSLPQSINARAISSFISTELSAKLKIMKFLWKRKAAHNWKKKVKRFQKTSMKIVVLIIASPSPPASQQVCLILAKTALSVSQ